MAGQYSHFTPKNSSSCEVCDVPLNPIEVSKQSAIQYIVCRSFECKKIMQQCSTITPHASKLHFELQRKLVNGRKQFQIDEKKRIEVLEKQHKVENQLILSKTLVANPDISMGNIHVVETPTGLKNTSPLDSERIEQYKSFLRGLIEQASHYANQNAVPFEDLREIQNKRTALDPHMQDNPKVKVKVKVISEAPCTV